MNTNRTRSQEKPSSHKTDESDALRALSHRLCNIQGIIESSINLLNNAEDKSMTKRWSTMRNILMATGRDRINREMVIYCTKKETIESISREIYRTVYETLTIANRNYKSLFDLIDHSMSYSDEEKNASVSAGKEITDLLVHIIKKLEVVKIGLQKTENLDR